ncbi:hypothetical protein LINPERPRIM_LOCUS25207 [Linum perenne]
MLQFGLWGVTCSFEVQTTCRQNRWNQDDETDVLGQNSESAFRLSLSFQLEVVGEPSLEQQLWWLEVGYNRQVKDGD